MKPSSMTIRKLGLAAAVFLATAAISVMADDGASTHGDYARGVQRWADNCGRCHNIRDPKEFRDDQWKVIVTHMRVRAGLTGQDARDILEFLQRSN
jgi:cytochrome c553